MQDYRITRGTKSEEEAILRGLGLFVPPILPTAFVYPFPLWVLVPCGFQVLSFSTFTALSRPVGLEAKGQVLKHSG